MAEENASISATPSTLGLKNIEADEDAIKALDREYIPLVVEFLRLCDDTHSVTIASNVLTNGRQKLLDYQDDIAVNIFDQQMKPDSALLRQLMSYVQRVWSVTTPWLEAFLSQQLSSAKSLYDQVVTRAAEAAIYRTPLSVLVQFVYQLINDTDFEKEGKFHYLIWDLTEHGLKVVAQSSNAEQQMLLFRALQDYHREHMFDVMQSSGISESNKELYDHVLKCVVESGWDGIFVDEKIKWELSPKVFRQLQLNIEQFKKPWQLSCLLTSTSTSTSGLIQSPISSWDIERAAVKTCRLYKFQAKDLVKAGELLYMNNTLQSIVNDIVIASKSDDEYNFIKLAEACFIPIMYLLKREQNLTDFVHLLKWSVGKKCQPRVSCRLLIDLLMENSDFCISRTIIYLLSKRNPVPMFQPGLNNDQIRFVPEILDVWDCSRPAILSFSIGPCKGKSSLLNALFLTRMEQSTPSSYFQGTIDIDFGYHFIPHRSVIIADVHGQLTKENFTRIAPIFDGFLVHIQASYLNSNMPAVLDFMQMIPVDSYSQVLIRDVTNENDDDDENDTNTIDYSVHFPRSKTTPLPRIANKDSVNNQKLINSLRAEIRNDVAHLQTTRCQEFQVKAHLRTLLPPDDLTSLVGIENFIDRVRPTLVQGPKTDYPLYDIFTQICQCKKKMAKVDFYGPTESMKMFDLQMEIIELEKRLSSSTECGAAFNLFKELLLHRETMLFNLDVLSTELKRERDRKLSTSEKAEDLPFEKMLSIELHWRNTIVCHDRSSANVQRLLCSAFAEYVDHGKPFEIIDGDNFCIQSAFLENALVGFRDKKFFVISVIGPQNSGKSTLLNYMFGTLFDVRNGRCTRGVYGSVVKSNIPSKFEYIMLIDTEGLLALERSDPEYDRRLILFCLAVSHVVIVNIHGEITKPLEEMLTLCTDSLKHLGVNKVDRPVLHFVVNQQIDPNIDNHKAAIKGILTILSKIGLNNLIELDENNFHTLQSAFQNERFIDGIALHTDSDFLERVQNLSNKVIFSAAKSIEQPREQFADLQRWIRFATTVFDIMQKYPDLTYFNDVLEREQDAKMCQYIGKMIREYFTRDYRLNLFIEVATYNERNTVDFFNAKFDDWKNRCVDELDEQLKLCAATETIRKRSHRFVEAQLTGMRDAWCAVALNNKEREKMKRLVRDGDDFLRELINSAIDQGSMTKDKATAQFEEMWTMSTEKIQEGFKDDEELNKALQYVYRNYNIFEKTNLPELSHIVSHLDILRRLKTASIDDILSQIAYQCVAFAFMHTPIEEHEFKITASAEYTVKTIDAFQYLNRSVLKDEFYAYDHDHQQKVQSKKSSSWWGRITTRTTTQATNRSCRETVKWTPKLHEHLKNFILRKDSEPADHDNPSGMWKQVFRLNFCFARLIDTITKTVILPNGSPRLVDTDLIQQLIIELHSLFIGINHELDIFKLSASKHLHSALHICLLLILTQLFYVEAVTYFNNVLVPVLNNHDNLLTYFIRMVVPNHTDDEKFAKGLVRKLHHILRDILIQQARDIIKEQIEVRDAKILSRKSLLAQLKMRVRSENDDWLIDFILKPVEKLEETFEMEWKKSEAEIDRQILATKNALKVILNEFFLRLQTTRNCLKIKQAHLPTYIADLFETSSGVANENLTKKGVCMSQLLYFYFANQQIPEIFMVGPSRARQTFRLQNDGKYTFEAMPKSTDALSKAIIAIKDQFWRMSISNINVFLKHAVILKDQTLDDFEKLDDTFAKLDGGITKPKQLFKSRGCGQTCPCCRRLCDLDHTLNRTEVQSSADNHRCDSGHQYRAMGGFRREYDNQASLLFCEQIADDECIIDPELNSREKWLDFKNKHANWTWPIAPPCSSPRAARPADSSHFEYIWVKVGAKLCEKYNNGMIYTTDNSSEPAVKLKHYILILDRSGSMTDDPWAELLTADEMNEEPLTETLRAKMMTGAPWKKLLEAVGNFTTIRIEKGRSDLLTVIVFGDFTAVPVSHMDVSKINVAHNMHAQHCMTTSNIKCTCQMIAKIDVTNVGRGSEFGKAFQSVIETLKNAKANATLTKYSQTIVFMTDGHSPYPEKELETLSTEYAPMITQFWTMGLGDYDKELLERINNAMNGELVDIQTADDLVEVYGEIARLDQTNYPHT